MMQAIHSALGGIQQNLQRFEQHAGRIARAGDPGTGRPVDLPREIVGARTAQHGYEANLAVLDAADGMIGSLLDVLA